MKSFFANHGLPQGRLCNFRLKLFEQHKRCIF